MSGGAGGAMVQVQSLRPKDVPRRVALVFCMDENGFAREVVEASSKHIAYRTTSGISLHISVSAALVAHRVCHLKKIDRRNRRRTSVLRRALDWVTLREPKEPLRSYTYSFSEEDSRELQRGDLDARSALDLRRRWFSLLAKGREYKSQEYEQYLLRPPEPALGLLLFS